MKHEKDRHTPRKYTTCVFFAKGICNRGDACYFSRYLAPFCKYQDECPFWPRCKFVHQENEPKKHCFYQDNCRKPYCKFYHFYNEEVCFFRTTQPQLSDRVPPFARSKFPNVETLVKSKKPKKIEESWGTRVKGKVNLKNN